MVKTARMVCLTAVMALGVIVALPSVAAAAGTLDQAYEGSSPGGGIVTAALSLAQTFTASRSGQLDRVDVYMGSSFNTYDLTVQIQGVDANGKPSGTVLGSAVVPAANFPAPSTSAWVPVAISAPSVGNTLYAIVLTTTSGDCGQVGCDVWFGQGDNPYARGVGWQRSNNGTALWVDAGNGDFLFRTYVVSPPSPPAQVCPQVSPTGTVSGLVWSLGKSLNAPAVQQLACSLPL